MKITSVIMKAVKDTFFMKLIKNNTGVSSKNFFLVCVTLIGLVLLGVVIAGFIVDMIFNHTITVNMSDAAAFIASVASLFAAAGLTKAGSEWSENKFIYNTSNSANKVNNNPNSQMCEGDTEDIPIPDEGEVTDEDDNKEKGSE